MSLDTLNWTAVCAVDEILPNTGVCALVEGRHVAVFRVGPDRFFARAAARAAAAAKQDAVCSRVLAGRVVAGSRCRASSTPAPSSQNLNGSM